MANLKAGLIGLGMMGRNHARVLSSLDGVDLVAVADPNGDPHGACSNLSVLTNIDDLVKSGIDYCTVAAPTAFHEEIAIVLAQAGIHALIEKPLSYDVASANRIEAAFSQAGLIAAVGHIERYNPALQSARARLEQGELGQVFQIATRRQGPYPGRIADVGVVKDLATHDIDLTSWVTQQPYLSVAAQTAHRSGRDHEDLVAAVGMLKGGIVTSHLVNWLSPMKERVAVITGERGAFVADTLTADLTFYANGSIPTQWTGLQQFRGVSEGDMVRFAIPKPEPLRTEHEAFRDALLGEESDVVTLKQGLMTVKVAEAMIAAAQSGALISIGDAS